jgi:hypothetical protein
VILAERPSKRSVRERLFGRGTRNSATEADEFPEPPGSEAKKETEERNG